MNYDEMKRRVKAIQALTVEIEHCQYLSEQDTKAVQNICILFKPPDNGKINYPPDLSLPQWLILPVCAFVGEQMIRRIQRLRDNIKIIEEMSDNVRLAAESGPMDSARADSPDVI
jgi:hypothetical protein